MSKKPDSKEAEFVIIPRLIAAWSQIEAKDSMHCLLSRLHLQSNVTSGDSVLFSQMPVSSTPSSVAQLFVCVNMTLCRAISHETHSTMVDNIWQADGRKYCIPVVLPRI